MAPDGVGEQTLGLELFEDPLVARDKTSVEQRHQIFRVIKLDQIEIFQLTHLMADVEPEIPQRVQDRLDGPFLGRANGTVDDDQ